MSAPFSRLQLAAALLEYDNDPDDPEAPYRSAHDSAIFAHLRRNWGGKESVLGDGRSRVSRASINTLRNPFGGDDNFEDEDEVGEEELEVDLASWGLDAFMPKDKNSKSSKGKGKAPVPSTHPVSSLRSRQPSATSMTAPRRAQRSMSVGGNLDSYGSLSGLVSEGQPSNHTDDNRRRSIGSPLDLVDLPPAVPPQPAAHPAVGSQMVPFPTRSIRSPSPHAFDVALAPGASVLTDIPKSREQQRYSNASLDSKLVLNQEQDSNQRPRVMSNATLGSTFPTSDNPFALGPPSHMSRFDPKAVAHARTMSNASLGTRRMLDNDGASVATGQGQNPRERRYSTTLELLRPKILVMPSPLQPVGPAPQQPAIMPRDGFHLSTGGPPLPPGARSTQRLTMVSSPTDAFPIAAPIASNSFTPNPLTSLSLSQQTFRNTLMVGGQVLSSEPRATEDGDQVFLEPQPEAPVVVTPPVEEPPTFGRPAGKLFGKSLIDDLENRKAQMRSKQRVFTGDQRPSMMARGSQQRTSTLIDPAALQAAAPQRTSSSGSQGLSRRLSVKPLLNFDDDGKIPQPGLSPGPRTPNSRSVFGVDTLWEREMVKLKEMETRDKLEAEEQKKREEAEEAKKQGKRRKKKKTKNEVVDPNMNPATPAEPRVSAEPPILPSIPPTNKRAPPRPPVGESGSEDSDTPSLGAHPLSNPQGWYAGSSDEEDNDGPRRTTGTGPRFPSKSRRRPSIPLKDDSEEEDVPLAEALTRAAQRATRFQNESDEEKPLSVLLNESKSINFGINFDSITGNTQPTGDDDDEPLGLRVSRVGVSPRSQHLGRQGDDDDDQPLAFHPEQQRRTQYQLMAQQQQQQQLMMQAQFQSSMFFGPPVGSGFFPPPMMQPPMVMQQPPMPLPSPPPLHDEVKYGRVDRWRRDVAVEGEP
ncbi:hypothetical protein BD779DRAFT_1491321 [Infundibulicybe gibba]|nr:hypothetical protein BD779DRAFT_1491321 [Infundibulicybe gibba]